MKTIYSLMLIALFTMISCKDDSDSPTPSTIEFFGKIIEYQTNEPMPDILLSTLNGEISVISDSSGHFLCSINKDTKYNLFVSSPGYYTTNKLIEVETENIENKILWMSKIIQDKTIMRGYITDSETNIPLPNVKIFSPIGISTFSTIDGYYELLLPEESCIIYTDLQDYSIYSEKIESLPPSMIEKNISLVGGEKSISLECLITNNRTAEPIQGIKVFIDGNTEYLESNENGNITLKFNRYGNNSIRFVHENYEDITEIVKIPTTIDTLKIQLSQLYKISGTVKFKEDNSPANNVIIKIPKIPMSILSDENGNFSLSLKTGLYTLYTEYEGYYSENTNITVNDDIDNIEFSLFKLDTARFVDRQVVYYDFENEKIFDITEHGYDGVIHRGHSFVYGKFGKAIRLIGNGAVATMGGHITLPTIDFKIYPEFTINIWVKEEGYTNKGGEGFFFAGNHKRGAVYIGNLSKHSKDGGSSERYLHFSTGSSSSSSDPSPLYVNSSLLIPNDWNMLSLTYKNGLMSAYVNGELIKSIHQNLKLSGENIGLGIHYWDSNSSTRFTGCLDEFRIFYQSLSESQILDLYYRNSIKF